MTPEQSQAFITHFSKKYLADLLPKEVLQNLNEIKFDNGTERLIEHWDHKIALLTDAANATRHPTEQSNYLDDIKQALWKNKKVWLGYEGRDKDFLFSIFGLVRRNQQFYVVGSYRDFQEPCLLSVRKFTQFKLSEEDSMSPPENFHLQNFAEDYVDQPSEQIIPTLEVKFPIHLLSYVKAYPLYCVTDPDINKHGDFFTLRAENVPNSLRLRQWLGGFDEQAQIIQPEALRKTINHSLIDELTNLYNRRFFDQLLQREILRYCRDANYCFSLLSVDIDHFKQINGTYGRKVGDEALKQVSNCFKQLRGQDAIRFGGEEFIILLTEATHDEDALIVAERIRNEVNAISVYVDDISEPIRLTISIGIAEFPKHLPESLKTHQHQGKVDAKTTQELSEAIIKQADDALNRAKKAGRNRCELANGLTNQRAELLTQYLPTFLKKAFITSH